METAKTVPFLPSVQDILPVPVSYERPPLASQIDVSVYLKPKPVPASAEPSFTGPMSMHEKRVTEIRALDEARAEQYRDEIDKIKLFASQHDLEVAVWSQAGAW
jgi:hypothetical protein